MLRLQFDIRIKVGGKPQVFLFDNAFVGDSKCANKWWKYRKLLKTQIESRYEYKLCFHGLCKLKSICIIVCVRIETVEERGGTHNKYYLTSKYQVTFSFSTCTVKWLQLHYVQIIAYFAFYWGLIQNVIASEQMRVLIVSSFSRACLCAQ